MCHKVCPTWFHFSSSVTVACRDKDNFDSTVKMLLKLTTVDVVLARCEWKLQFWHHEDFAFESTNPGFKQCPAANFIRVAAAHKYEKKNHFSVTFSHSQVTAVTFRIWLPGHCLDTGLLSVTFAQVKNLFVLLTYNFRFWSAKIQM